MALITAETYTAFLPEASRALVAASMAAVVFMVEVVGFMAVAVDLMGAVVMVADDTSDRMYRNLKTDREFRNGEQHHAKEKIDLRRT